MRDLVKNHLLQVLTLVAMGPPVDTSPRALADERTKVLRSMRALVRAGKRLATSATEVLVEFTRPPKLFFARHGVSSPHPNQVVFRLDRSARISLRVQINETGEDIVSRPVELAYEYDEHREGPTESAYARLLGDAMDGDHSLFAHADEVEEAWRVVAPILTTPGPVHPYEPGSWGPAQADELLTGDGAWHCPGKRQ